MAEFQVGDRLTLVKAWSPVADPFMGTTATVVKVDRSRYFMDWDHPGAHHLWSRGWFGPDGLRAYFDKADGPW